MLEMRNISKEFPGVRALSEVSLTIRPGEILGLCGENGAGKSTLMKILSGVIPYPEYDGQILMDGRETRFRAPAEAEARGVAIIHQELNLFPELAVSENLFLGAERTQWGVIDWYESKAAAKALLDRYRVAVDPDAKVKDLSIGKNQLVEIARALSKNARYLILDEPTSALTEEEVENLFRILRDLRAGGMAGVYISHKLDEIKKICDSIAVLRDGRRIGEVSPTAGLNRNDIVKAMVGRDIENLYPRVESSPGEVLLDVRDFSVDHPLLPGEKIVEDVSFRVREGEILGVYGLMGSGRTELLTGIFGGFGPEDYSGEVVIRGQAASIRSPHDAITGGLGLCTEDRKVLGLFLEAAVQFNMSIVALDRFVEGGVVDGVREIGEIRTFIRDLEIKTPSEFQTARALSGGTQQKVLLARWLMRDPAVLFLDEPTRGVDVGAKTEIYRIMNRMKESRKGIVMVTSDLSELLGMSDRVLVMREGRSVGAFERSEATAEKIGALATGNV
ncbi:MAG: hypothetical protein A3G34_16465 [Candidatus Lindowbacteria bacterium RIFCSPLOWO2_12_FULL_62_27]|nr:MAG: hypothetical protein A3G34_16465 [Candidatus Lindowbacteria bacterium RIFCSPLOWO2_12_FULL_62_27]